MLKIFQIFIFSIGLLSTAVHSTQARTVVDVELPNGEIIPIHKVTSESSEFPVLLWLPSHRGLQPALYGVADGLAQIGIEVWLADLHLAYMIDTGRSSVDQFPAQDIAELINLVHEETDRDVIVVANNRSAKNALEGVRELQLSNSPMSVRGVILFSPALTNPAASPGQVATYKSVAQSTNVPVYIFQAGISTRSWRVDELARVLRGGGSQVYVKKLAGIQSGYLQRREDDLTELDLAERADAPFQISRAIQALSFSAIPEQAVNFKTEVMPTTENSNRYGLKPLEGELPSFLNLPDLNGVLVSLDTMNHKATIVSFWASWCSPCLKELPSLYELYLHYKDRGLAIVTVNVGEDRSVIERMEQEFSMQEYINLQDIEGIEMRRWNVYGFPTNFVVNESGTFSYGSFGAVDWNDPEVRKLIEDQLNKSG